MTLIKPLQSKEVHWSEPLMFIIAPQGRFWSFFTAVLFWPVALLQQWFRVKVPLQRGLEPDELDLGCSQLLPETGELTLSEPPQVINKLLNLLNFSIVWLHAIEMRQIFEILHGYTRVRPDYTGWDTLSQIKSSCVPFIVLKCLTVTHFKKYENKIIWVSSL